MWARKQLCKQDELSIIRDARDFALLNGLVLRYPNLSNDNQVAHIPFTLFPSPFPKSLYQDCVEIQPIVNTLMLRIACDIDLIEDTISPIAQVDDFTRNLLKVNKIVQKEGLAQPKVACINRADYMLDAYQDDTSNEKLRIRQVEMNAIASSMAAHSCNVKSMHDYLRSKYQISTPRGVYFPKDESLSLVAEGLIDCFNQYGKEDSYILLVTEPRSFNFSDQFLIELAVHKLRPDIKIVRQRFIDMPEKISLGPNKELLVEESKEIALVYFRYCYDPTNYDFKEAWDVRLMIERSRAIKCPSINFHISGAKKFQQVLNGPGYLERSIGTDEAAKMRQVFCKFWSIDSTSPEGEEGFRFGLTTPKSLVLKPQREGGGHNIFGQDIKPFLETIARSDERSQYILMEYIESPRERNWLLLNDDLTDLNRLDKHDQLVSELGIFGSIIAEGQNVISNKSGGYLVRSKKYGIDEGGVAAGYAGISSLLLFDDSQYDDDRRSQFYGS